MARLDQRGGYLRDQRGEQIEIGAADEGDAGLQLATEQAIELSAASSPPNPRPMIGTPASGLCPLGVFGARAARGGGGAGG